MAFFGAQRLFRHAPLGRIRKLTNTAHWGVNRSVQSEPSNAFIECQCAFCGRRFQSETKMSATLKKCPQCNGAVRVPPSGSTPLPEPGSSPRQLRCAECGEPVGEGLTACATCGAPLAVSQPKSRSHHIGIARSSVRSTSNLPKDGKPSVVTTALWNPIIVSLLGIPLGFMWSSALIALNWHAMRKPLHATFAWAFAVGYGVFIQRPMIDTFPFPWPCLIGILVWFPALGLPQLQYIRKHITDQSRQTWLLPVALGVALQTIVFISAASVHRQLASGINPAAPSSPVIQRQYTVEELAKVAEPYVFEVRTKWREPFLLLWSTDSGCAGSAVVIRAVPGEIYFVTNRHVVEPPAEAKGFSCAIGDTGQFVSVEVLAYGKNGLDLALLRIRSDSIKDRFEMPLQPLNAVAVGQQCVAIGNALGAGKSVTTGVVSRIDDFGNHQRIRTSAPISPGNSGGGLFALNGGALMGITTASSSASEAQNINLAMPTNYFAGSDAWDYLPGVTP